MMAEKLLQGKVALVTGAGRGIGRAIAVALAGQGASLALAARTPADLKDVQKTVEGMGVKAAVFPTDVAKEDQLLALLKGTIDTFGRLDILVNDAAHGGAKPFLELTTAEWDLAFATNVRGPFILCREAVPYLKKNTPSFIVNIISIGARRCYVNTAAYAASKHALRAMSIVLSQELKDTGVRVHCINPGGVATSAMARGLKAGNRPDLVNAKMIQPEEIAGMLIYLVTHGEGGIIDELSMRRADSNYWCFI
jgi:3-oxoacyl-[acyl-carrier protein] reductase